MTDFVYSGGVRFDDAAVADVTMDKDGHPLTCKNPITGEEISGGGGSSDFSTAEVTIVNNTNQPLAMYMTNLYIDENFNCVRNTLVVARGTTKILVPLYKGFCEYDSQSYPEAAPTPSEVSGNVEKDEGVFYITGDCTFTFN